MNVVALAGAALSGLFAGYLVDRLLADHGQGDFRVHLQFTKALLAGEPPPGNFLLYALDALFAGFSATPQRLLFGLLVIIVLATAAKVLLSVLYVASEGGRTLTRGVPLWGLCGGVACLFTFSLPWGTRYLGEIPPNVWHNTTTMLLMPLALGLFWTSLSFLRTGSRTMLWLTLALAAVNVAAKPSFVFCFLAAFPVAALLARRRRRDVTLAWVTCAGVALMVLAQYAYIYLAQLGGTAGKPGLEKDGVGIAPWRVWSAFTDNIPASALMSYVFPIVALIAGGVAVRRNLAVRYAAALAVVGLAIWALFRETGPRELHGNFFWQAAVTNYLLFLALVAAVVPWLRQNRFGIRSALVVIAFLIHLVAGVDYLHYLLTTGKFY